MERRYDREALFRLPGEQRGLKIYEGRKLVVELYLRTQQVLLDPRYKWGGGNHKPSNSHIWSLVRNASIFEIPDGLYSALYSEAIKELLKRADVPAESLSNDNISPVQSDRLKQIVINYSNGIQFPDPLPFDSVYIALIRPVQLSDEQCSIFFVPAGIDAWVYALLLSSNGDAFILSIGVDHARESSGVHIIQVAQEGVWINLLTLSPLVLSWIVRWINEHQTIIEESTKLFSYRHEFKQQSKKNKLKLSIPAPYYTIYIKDIHIKEPFSKLESLRQRAAQQHRSSVRGHWCVRVQRGLLPLDKKLEKQLRKDPNRKVYTTERPDAETAYFLASRGIAAKKSDEWLAVLVYWRSDYVKGPDGAPYIPAVRKSAKKYPDPPKTLLPKGEIYE